MSAEKNVETVQRFLSQGDLSAMAVDAEFIDFTQPEPIFGNKAISESIYKHYNVQFHETDAEMINIVAGEKSVVMEFIFRGTHMGEIYGIAPTGKKVEIPMCVIYDVEEGLITKGRLYYDAASMQRQLGIATVAPKE